MICLLFLVCPRLSKAKGTEHLRNRPLTTKRVIRALKVAEWIVQQKKQTSFLPKGVPLLLLSYVLPSMARVGSSQQLKAFEKVAVGFGYPKVDELHRAVEAHKNVLGRNVPVNDGEFLAA